MPPAEARALACGSCGLSFDLRGRLFDTLGPAEREERAAEVEAFYNDAPFPGYSPGDDGAALMDRCRAAPYLRQLDPDGLKQLLSRPRSFHAHQDRATAPTAAQEALAGAVPKAFACSECPASFDTVSYRLTAAPHKRRERLYPELHRMHKTMTAAEAAARGRGRSR